MHPTQAYRAVLLGVCCAFPAVAQAEDAAANQVMLAPGKSMTFVDQSNPGMQVVVTAPGDAYLNLSNLIRASEKGGIYSILSNVQIKEASGISANADGSISLRASTATPVVVHRDVQAGPGRVTLEGGVAAFERGNVVIYNAVVATQGTPAKVPSSTVAPAALPLQLPVLSSIPAPASAAAAALPAGGKQVGALVNTQTINAQTIAPATFQTFSIGAAGAVSISAGNAPVLNSVATGSISTAGGNLAATGAPIILNPAGAVTGNAGTVTLSVGPMPAGANISIGGSLPKGGSIVPAGAMPPSGVPKLVIK